MTDDLVKRLRDKHCCDATKCNCDEAADRIEQLEAALRPLVNWDKAVELFAPELGGLSIALWNARASLAGEKKDD